MLSRWPFHAQEGVNPDLLGVSRCVQVVQTSLDHLLRRDLGTTDVPVAEVRFEAAKSTAAEGPRKRIDRSDDIVYEKRKVEPRRIRLRGVRLPILPTSPSVSLSNLHGEAVVAALKLPPQVIAVRPFAIARDQSYRPGQAEIEYQVTCTPP
jgi:hypothetical protein